MHGKSAWFLTGVVAGIFYGNAGADFLKRHLQNGAAIIFVFIPLFF
jgi:hypothetical protein